MTVLYLCDRCNNEIPHERSEVPTLNHRFENVPDIGGVWLCDKCILLFKKYIKDFFHDDL